MKRWSSIPLFIGGYNVVAHLIYATLGRLTTSEVEAKGLVWIFYLVPSIYMLVSGVLSLFAIILAIVIIAMKRLPLIFGIVAISINVIYIFLYIGWMSMQ